ncbi:MAG: YceI family protein [Deltaproteobacteria bacterium]|nr:YceI family protein [Deltaproteobacteria bacterium]
MDSRHYKVSGTFTMRGKSRPLTLDVRVREIDGAKAKRLGLANSTDSAWLRVRGSFKVKLSDHGVKIPGMAAAKVNDEWTVKISLFAVEKK